MTYKFLFIITQAKQHLNHNFIPCELPSQTTNTSFPPTGTKKMDAILSLQMHKHLATSQLHNTELKKLVYVLRGVPTAASASLDVYRHVVKDQVKALPRRLQQSVLSRSTNLCPTHRGLHHQLITEMWSWVQHEFNDGIGKHIFPVIMGRRLSAEQEHQIRQLEPVLQMWRTDFRPETSAPPGRNPISGNSKWSYQIDQCPACMLARIGSDKKVLFALYAGMIGRFPKHKLSSVRLSLEELNVRTLDNPKSKRVHFVRYWLKASTEGDTSLFEATNLGIVLKKLHKEWKRDHDSNRRSIYGVQHNLGGSLVQDLPANPVYDNHNVDRRRAGQPNKAIDLTPQDDSRYSPEFCTDFSMGESHQYTNSLYPHHVDPKIGPQPRSDRLNPHSPLEPLGFKTSNHRAGVSTRSSKPHLASESDSDFTVYPEDSISQPASLRIKTAHRIKRRDYVAPVLPFIPRRLDAQPSAANLLNSTKASDPSPSASHIHTVFSRSTDRTSLASTTTIMSYNGEEHDFPVPQRQSMYFGYGYEIRDPFEDADEVSEPDDNVNDDNDNNNGRLN
jgi:hypothetical protein